MNPYTHDSTAYCRSTIDCEDMTCIQSDDGLLLVRPSNGQADSTSEFMFGIILGYEIKNGKIGKAIKDTTISGVAFDMLDTVTMVSRDMKWKSGGMWRQETALLPVGMGGLLLNAKLT